MTKQWVSLDEDALTLIESRKETAGTDTIPVESDTDDGNALVAAAASKNDDWATPEQKEFWLRTDHYLNGTRNLKADTKQGGLITQLRDTLVHRRTDHTKEKDELLTELIDHLGKFTDGADISSVFPPPSH